MEQVEARAIQSSPPPAVIFRTACFGLLAGFIVGFWFELPALVLVVAILAVIVIVWQRLAPLLVGIFVIGCLAALLRGNGLMPPPLEQYFLGRQIFTAKIVELPRLGERVRRYVVKPLSQGQDFRLLVVAPAWPEYSYGDILNFQCQTVELVTFKPYTNRGIWRSCAFPEVEFLERDPKGIRYWLYSMRRQAGDRLRALTPEPYATLATGMMWGDDSGLPTELMEDFRRTGTTHLLAVSGFNVMVLTKVLFWLFIYLGLWRRQASSAVLAAVALFVVFSGAEPSVVRAGAMGSVLLVGNLLARKPDNLNLLSGTAAVMLLVSPRLVAELGWQLSFAAMIGLTYLSPLLVQKINFLPQFLGLRQSAAETLAATIVTMPIILARIGQLSIITPLANLMVAPVVVLVYWFGLGLLALGAVSYILAAPAVWLLSAVLFYLTTVVSWLAGLPWAAVQSSYLAWLMMVFFYATAAVWLFRPAKLRIKNKNR